MDNLIIRNALVNGKLCNIKCKDGIISEITTGQESGGIDAAGRRVIPGMVEVHAHGCIGMDALDGDYGPMCSYLASKGTTSWLPTTMTASIEKLREVTNSKTDFPGTHILGFHLEGPYISVKYKGAQNEEYIKAPSIEEYNTLKNVKMITLAPELSGSMEFIKYVTSKGTVVTLGHTDTDYDTACEAIDNGANCLTHTFNAMQPIHHRKPGPICAAAEKGAYAQIICDGIHIHKSVILAAYKMFGPDRLTLISDAIRPAGLPEGSVSESGGIPVEVRNGAVYLKDSDVLGGSGSTLWHCVCVAVEMGIPFEDAVKMATATPAKLIGANKGVVAEGYDADLLIINDNMEIDKVIISGQEFCA